MLNGIVRLLVDGIALLGLIGGLAALVPGHQPRPDVAVLGLLLEVDPGRNPKPTPLLAAEPSQS